VLLPCVPQPIQAPDEVVWLNGAPGSGKGANTPFICESRGISRAITMCARPARHDTMRAADGADACSVQSPLQCVTLTRQSYRPCRSSLLDSSEEIRAIKNRGELVPDTLVCTAASIPSLTALLCSAAANQAHGGNEAPDGESCMHAGRGCAPEHDLRSSGGRRQRPADRRLPTHRHAGAHCALLAPK
jgi:hypothetical protein